MCNTSSLPSETFNLILDLYTIYLEPTASGYSSFLFNLLYHIYVQQISILHREF